MNKKAQKQTFDNSLGSCLKTFWTDYCGWGRATRSEFWWVQLFYNFLAPAVLACSIVGIVLLPFWYVAVMIPNFCLTARRLHDAGMSNWLILINIIPFVGFIIFLILLCTEGDEKSNRFGAPRI